MKKQKKTNPSEKITSIQDMSSPNTDPNGSYTGVPDNPKEKPVQDADDL